MYAIRTQQDTVTGNDRNLVNMNRRGQRPTQGLGYTTPQPEVAELQIGKIIDMHRLVNAVSILLTNHLIFYQPSQQSIIDRQAFERLMLA